MPFKLCYYGEVVRKNGTMLRPERQFLQIGAECIGENSFLADVEILELAYKSLSLVGIKDITLEKPKEDELLIAENSKINQNKQRCQFIKKNGKRCRQVGKPSQSGGPIINGYCSYHRKRK